ncbi:MAG: immunoglobulin-like domain-containing protein, partial [Patescibacteria group bacterium]
LSGQGIINVNYITSANWRILEDGTLEAKKVITDRIEVKKPFGLTIYDTVTGGPVCVISEAGVLRSLTGSCEANEASQTTPSVPPTPSEPAPPADTTAPVIKIIGANPAEIAIGATYGDLGVTVTDNVDQNLGYSASLDGGPELSQGVSLTIDTSVAATHTITYKAVDNAGNIGTAQRIVNVIDLNASTTPIQ